MALDPGWCPLPQNPRTTGMWPHECQCSGFHLLWPPVGCGEVHIPPAWNLPFPLPHIHTHTHSHTLPQTLWLFWASNNFFQPLTDYKRQNLSEKTFISKLPHHMLFLYLFNRGSWDHYFVVLHWNVMVSFPAFITPWDFWNSEPILLIHVYLSNTFLF